MESTLYLVCVAAVLVLSVLIYRRRRRPGQRREEDQTARLALLAADLRAGGAGLVGGRGRVEGEVRVDVMSDRASCVGVCASPGLQVIYWFRLGLDNGHQVRLGGDSGQTTARTAVAAIRLWGEMWAGASSVSLHLAPLTQSRDRARISQQAEDCETKYGVRVSLHYDQEGQEGGSEGGGRDLALQLLAGGGVGQQEEGWYNNNLRMVDTTIHQLVDHTGRLAKHYFEL